MLGRLPGVTCCRRGQLCSASEQVCHFVSRMLAEGGDGGSRQSSSKCGRPGGETLPTTPANRLKGGFGHSDIVFQYRWARVNHAMCHCDWGFTINRKAKARTKELQPEGPKILSFSPTSQTASHHFIVATDDFSDRLAGV